MPLIALAPPRPPPLHPSTRASGCGYLRNELPFLAFYWLMAPTLLGLRPGRSRLTRAAGRRSVWRADDGRARDRGLWGAFGRPGCRPRPDEGLRWRVGRATVEPERRPGYAHRPWAAYCSDHSPAARPDVERVRQPPLRRPGNQNLLDLTAIVPSRGQPGRSSISRGRVQHGGKHREARPSSTGCEPGWVGVSANYRPEPEQPGSPDQHGTPRRCIGLVRDHGPRYGADPDGDVRRGISAGDIWRAGT